MKTKENKMKSQISDLMNQVDSNNNNNQNILIEMKETEFSPINSPRSNQQQTANSYQLSQLKKDIKNANSMRYSLKNKIDSLSKKVDSPSLNNLEDDKTNNLEIPSIELTPSNDDLVKTPKSSEFEVVRRGRSLTLDSKSRNKLSQNFNFEPTNGSNVVSSPTSANSRSSKGRSKYSASPVSTNIKK